MPAGLLAQAHDTQGSGDRALSPHDVARLLDRVGAAYDLSTGVQQKVFEVERLHCIVFRNEHASAMKRDVCRCKGRERG